MVVSRSNVNLLFYFKPAFTIFYRKPSANLERAGKTNLADERLKQFRVGFFLTFYEVSR